MIKVFPNFPPEKGRKTKQIKRWKLPEIIAFPSLLFSILHIKLLFWAHRSKVLRGILRGKLRRCLTDGFQTSNFTTHRREAEPWGLVSNFQHHCSGMQGNLLSFKFQILLILTLTLLLTSFSVKLFLFVTEILNKMSKECTSRQHKHDREGEGNFKHRTSQISNSVFSISTFLLSAQLFNQLSQAGKSKISI